MSDSPSPAPIVVDLWTDVVCPWCYLGESRLHDAIDAEGLTGRVHLRVHSFELDPAAPVAAGHSTIEHLVEAKSMTEPDVRAMEERIGQMARDLGRDYVIERPMANTRGVHRVMHAVSAAHGEEAGRAFFLELQRDYFAGRANPFDAEQVLARARAAGLDRAAAEDALQGRSQEEAVAADVREAAELGARGVPFFVLDGKYAVPGALDLDSFRDALRLVVAEADA